MKDLARAYLINGEIFCTDCAKAIKQKGDTVKGLWNAEGLEDDIECANCGGLI